MMDRSLRILGPLLSVVCDRSIGIHVGARSLEAVEIGPGVGGLRVFRQLIAPLPEGPGRADVLRDALAGFLGSSWRHPVTVVVPMQRLGFRTVRVPNRSGDALQKALPFLLSQALPVPREEILAAASFTEQAGAGPFPALAVWTRRGSVPELPAGRVDRLPDHAQPMPAALMSFASTFGREPLADETALVDVGPSETSIVLCRQGELRHSQSIAHGGGSPGDATAAVEALADALGRELRGIFQRVYVSTEPAAGQPSRVWLTGSGAASPQLAAALCTRLGIPVEPLPATVPGLKESALAGPLAIALGAAASLRGSPPGNLDLMPVRGSDTPVTVRDLPLAPTLVVIGTLAIHTMLACNLADSSTAELESRKAEMVAWTRSGRRDPVLERRMEDRVTATANDTVGTASPMLKLDASLRSLVTRAGAADVLAELRRKLRPPGAEDRARAERIVLTDASMSADEVTIGGSAASFEVVTALAHRLEQSLIFGAVRILSESARTDEGGTHFRLAVGRRR